MQTVTSTKSWNTTSKTDRIPASLTPNTHILRTFNGHLKYPLFFPSSHHPISQQCTVEKSDSYFCELICCTGQQIFVPSIYLFWFNRLNSEGYCCQPHLQWWWTKRRNKTPVCYSLLCHFPFRQRSCRIGEHPQTSRRPRTGSQWEMWWLTAKCNGRQAFTRHCSRTCILFVKGWCHFLYLPFPLQNEGLNQAGLQTPSTGVIYWVVLTFLWLEQTLGQKKRHCNFISTFYIFRRVQSHPYKRKAFRKITLLYTLHFSILCG